MANGIYLVHMKSIERMAKACESNGIMFDKKTVHSKTLV